MPLAQLLARSMAAISCALAVPMSHAQGVYKCVDESGRAQYTNVKSDTQGRTCTLVTKEVSVAPSPIAPAASVKSPNAQNGTTSAASASGPTNLANFPRVEPNTQRARDDSRRKILEEELISEERSLSKARQDLTEQESTRDGSERNYQRVLDRLRPYQDSVERHERNVAALRKELSNLR